jgi:IS1 family transposase
LSAGVALDIAFGLSGMFGCLPWYWGRCEDECQSERRQGFPHEQNVSQKPSRVGVVLGMLGVNKEHGVAFRVRPESIKPMSLMPVGSEGIKVNNLSIEVNKRETAPDALNPTAWQLFRTPSPDNAVFIWREEARVIPKQRIILAVGRREFHWLATSHHQPSTPNALYVGRGSADIDNRKNKLLGTGRFDAYRDPWSFSVDNGLSIPVSSASRFQGGGGLRTCMQNHLVRLFPSGLHLPELQMYRFGLLPDLIKSSIGKTYATPTNVNQQTGENSYSDCGSERPSINERFTMVLSLCFGGFLLAAWTTEHINDNRRVLRSSLVVCGLGSSELGLLFLIMSGLHPYTWGLPPQWLPAKWNPCPQDYRDYSPHREIVTQKHLTSSAFPYYNKTMANILPTEKQVAIIGSLCEGSSIRAIERMTGVHRDTVMRLGVRVGQGCTDMMNETLRDLNCTRLEMDEIWGFIGKKEKHVKPVDDPRAGDVWTFCAIDADSKLVPTFKVGKRTNAVAGAFVQDVASRMRNRVQISTDGLKAYVDAIEHSFGGDVDYAQIIKTYGHEEVSNNRRYSAPEFVSSEKRPIFGNPDVDLISTSYVERLNATTRLHMRRLTRLTLAFSKKFENFEAAVGLHFASYNFVKRHNTLRMTPAMAAGVSGTQWTVGELLKAAA